MSNNLLTANDRQFLRHAMKYFGVRFLKVDFDNSRKKYPDIWVSPNGNVPKITVTKEWMKQNTDERRKRFVHELLHVAGLEHNDKIQYSTYPDKDKFSKKVYADILGGTRKFDGRKFGL